MAAEKSLESCGDVPKCISQCTCSGCTSVALGNWKEDLENGRQNSSPVIAFPLQYAKE